MDDKYNGWSNYATWRVQLEYFADWPLNEPHTAEPYELSKTLRHELEDYIEETTQEGSLARGWALSFISEANYIEIAEYLLSYPLDPLAADEGEDE